MALRSGHSYVIALNAINEVAVESFIKNNIKFNSILNVIEESLSNVKNYEVVNLNDIFLVDKEARIVAKELIESGSF